MKRKRTKRSYRLPQVPKPIWPSVADMLAKGIMTPNEARNGMLLPKIRDDVYWNTLRVLPNDVDIVAHRAFVQEEIARVFRLPTGCLIDLSSVRINNEPIFIGIDWGKPDGESN